MAFDAARQRCVLFGGDASIFKELSDTWEWDGSNWTRIPTATNPSKRKQCIMVYDELRQRSVLYGGYFCVVRGHVIRCYGLGDTWDYGRAGRTLMATPTSLPIATGGTQSFTIDAGRRLANRSYWLFGSITGTRPGVLFEGLHVSLVPDFYTSIAVHAVNSREFAGFRGRLSAQGTARASLRVPGRLPVPPGFTFHHALVVYDGLSNRVLAASNPVTLRLR